MSIQKYIAFLKTIEYGSITEASKALDYSQSGVSRMINDLEEEWDLSLLERGRTGVRLTSDGIRVLPYIKNVCNEYYRLKEEIDSIHNVQTGLIRIGSVSSIASNWIPNVIKAFREKYPNIEYELLVGGYGKVEEWINQGRVDCGFLILPIKSDLETIFLERDRLLAVVPANHKLASLEKFPVDALNDEPFMLLESGNIEVEEIFKKHKIKPKINFRTLDDYVIMSMVECGFGVSILPELILNRTTYNIKAMELDKPEYRNIVLALKSRKSASPAVKRFIEHIQFRHT